MQQTSLILKEGSIILNGRQCLDPERLFFELLDQSERMPMELLPLDVVGSDVMQSIQEEISRSYPMPQKGFLTTQSEYNGKEEE